MSKERLKVKGYTYCLMEPFFRESLSTIKLSVKKESSVVRNTRMRVDSKTIFSMDRELRLQIGVFLRAHS